MQCDAFEWQHLNNFPNEIPKVFLVLQSMFEPKQSNGWQNLN